MSTLLQQMIVNTVDKYTLTKTYALNDVLIMLMQNYHWQEGSSYCFSRLSDLHIVKHKERMYTTACQAEHKTAQGSQGHESYHKTETTLYETRHSQNQT